MAKIPKNAQKEIARKCPICERRFKSKQYLVSHIDSNHKELIPKEWSASRYENYLRTGKTEGRCVVCKSPTEWNENTWKYSRLCKDKKCRESVSKEADKNMIGKYGKTTLLNDADQQRKMIYSKKTSGVYYWSTDDSKSYKMYYASSVEKKFLEMLDAFLDLDPADVMSPSPNNYVYEYDGKAHMYIPDVYIVSLNLEIELKEPINNQNKHPKIQAVDKVKEHLKDQVMESIDYVNYIKINGTDYREFFEYFSYLKQQDGKSPSDITTVIESAFTIPGINDDIDIDEVMDEILQEPVTEKSISDMSTDDFLRLSTTVMTNLEDIIRPDLDYRRTLDKIESDIGSCRSLSTAKIIKKNIANFRKYLKSVVGQNVDGEDNDLTGMYKKRREMHFEANKTLKKLVILDDKLDDTIRVLRRKGGEYYISEGYDPDSWYTVQESMIEGIHNGATFKPVFIMLSYTGSTMAKIIKKVTNGTYSHASISLDTKMDNMCSFNAKGFVNEDLSNKDFSNEDGKYALYMYMAPQIEYVKITDIIKSFNDNRESLKYSTIGLFNYITGKETNYDDQWFCSEFVSYLLNQVNPNLFKKHYSLYSPDDLANTRKFIKISSGRTIDYDHHAIDRTIRKILNRKGYEHVTVK